MLAYLDYKNIFPHSQLTENDFNNFVANFSIEVLSIISVNYDFNELYEADKNLALVVANQIYFAEQTGEYFDGIQNQSATNMSTTFKTEYSLGEYMWNKAAKNYIQGNYGVYVYV